MTQQQSRFDVIFAEGRKRYERKTGQRCDVGVFAKMTTVSDVRAYVEQENSRFDSFRDRHNTVYERLSAAFTPVERLGSLVATASSAGFPPAGVCLGAAALLIKSAQDVSSHYDNILDLFDILAGILTRLELHSLVQISPQLEENFANVFATLLEIIGYSAKAIARRRWKEYIARMLHGEDQKVTHLRQRLERLVQDGTSLVVEHIHKNVTSIANHTATTAVAVDDIQIKTNTIGMEITDLKGNSRLIMDLLQKQHQSQCDTNLYKILHPSQPNTDKMEGILRDRVAGTGNWLLSEPPFQAWLRRDKSLLWICGAPGCGKTFLASAIISAIQSNISIRPTGWDACTVGFFFLSKNDAHIRIGAFHQALRDVAWQITRLDANYADHVASQCRSAADIETLPSAWRKLFVGYFGASSRSSLYLVIDGLDEVEEGGEFGRAEFLKLLSDLQGTSKLNINLVLLGRPHLTQSIKVALYQSRSEMAKIHIEAHKNKEDLSNFIDQSISRRLQLDDASEDLKSYIRIRIEEKANGMFLWANLMLEILKWQTTEDDIRDSLRTAPTGIDDMITEMLKVYSSMFKGREAEEFNTILAWLSCAARPVTLAEIDAALRRLSPSASPVLALEKRFRDTYATLITLTRDDGLSTGSMQSHSMLEPQASIPAITTVAFSHATISEYFKKHIGKVAKRKTSTSIGVSRAAAECLMLQTCLEVFVEPGVGSWLASSQMLVPYAKSSWLFHLRVVELQMNNDQATQMFVELDAKGSNCHHILQLLFSFLNDEMVVQKWSHNMTWDVFTEANALAIAKTVEKTSQHISTELSTAVHEWTSKIKATPQFVFLPVAKVNATQSLHGEWYPLESLHVVAQVRALIEKEDTLECLPEAGKLTVDIIEKAIRWASLEVNASWHRNVAICYRRSGHLTEAMHHYEEALQLDHELVEARGGLAIAYEAQGYHTKAIELELTNAQILRKRLSLVNEDLPRQPNILQELSISYEAIANNYRLIDNETMALIYWRNAVETGAIQDGTIRKYLTALANQSCIARWREVVNLLRLLHDSTDCEGQNRLVKYMLQNNWPNEISPNFFHMAANAAKETECVPWLITAYEEAVKCASTQSHMSSLFLKLALVKLMAKYQHDYSAAEPIVEEVGDVASIMHEPRIQGLEDCKKAIARDYCRIAIRKCLRAKQTGGNTDLYVWRLQALCRSGVAPDDMTDKIICREISLIHLAHIQYVSGSLEDSTQTIRPFMSRCCSMTLEDPSSRAAGLQWLGVCLLALDRVADACDLMNHSFKYYGWLCDMCEYRAYSTLPASICRHCFDFVCHSCLQALSVDASRSGFCVPNHDLIDLSAETASADEAAIIFRAKPMSINDCIAMIETEWTLLQ